VIVRGSYISGDSRPREPLNNLQPLILLVLFSSRRKEERLL